eukprot:COSAG01_NODE_8668_length_2703_cov_4.591398_1_plen_231_part_00
MGSMGGGGGGGMMGGGMGGMGGGGMMGGGMGGGGMMGGGMMGGGMGPGGGRGGGSSLIGGGLLGMIGMNTAQQPQQPDRTAVWRAWVDELRKYVALIEPACARMALDELPFGEEDVRGFTARKGMKSTLTFHERCERGCPCLPLPLPLLVLVARPLPPIGAHHRSLGEPLSAERGPTAPRCPDLKVTAQRMGSWDITLFKSKLESDERRKPRRTMSIDQVAAVASFLAPF